MREALQALHRDFGIDVAVPFSRLPKKSRDILMLGGKAGGAKFEGIIPNMERRYRETDSVMVREDLARWGTVVKALGLRMD